MSKKSDLKKLASNPRAMAALGSVTDEVTGLEDAVRRVQQIGRDRFDWAGPVDGDPGNKTYAVLWHLAKPTEAETREIIFRAAEGRQVYRMDQQNCGWFEEKWDADGDGSDCSDFIALGLGRRKAGGPDWKNSKGQENWLHTGSIYHDATHDQKFFRLLDQPEPTCLFVYPDKGDSQGHVGFITGLVNGEPWGLDSSSSQSRKGDAIRLRDMGWTKKKVKTRGLIYVKPVWW